MLQLVLPISIHQPQLIRNEIAFRSAHSCVVWSQRGTEGNGKYDTLAIGVPRVGRVRSQCCKVSRQDHSSNQSTTEQASTPYRTSLTRRVVVGIKRRLVQDLWDLGSTG